MPSTNIPVEPIPFERNDFGPVSLVSTPTIEFHEEIGSTNDRAKELLKFLDPCRLPCLVLATTQTAGRGRGEKSWWSGKGSLAMSLGLNLNKFGLNRDDLALLSLAVGLAIAELLESKLPSSKKKSIGIHWPNDVYVDGRKIAGILIESPLPESAVIGIGLNVNNRLKDAPLEFSHLHLTSLIDLLDKETPLPLLTKELIIRLDEEIGRLKKSRGSVSSRVSARCVQIGKNIGLTCNNRDFSGRCLEIAPDGSLILETNEGIVPIR